MKHKQKSANHSTREPEKPSVWAGVSAFRYGHHTHSENKYQPAKLSLQGRQQYPHIYFATNSIKVYTRTTTSTTTTTGFQKQVSPCVNDGFVYILTHTHIHVKVLSLSLCSLHAKKEDHHY